MLKIVRRAFVAGPEISVHGFRAWRYLIWCSSEESHKLIQNSKRLSLLMKPITNAFGESSAVNKNEATPEVLRQAFSAWSHILNVLASYDSPSGPGLFSEVAFEKVLEPMFGLIIENNFCHETAPDILPKTISIFSALLESQPSGERASLEQAGSAVGEEEALVRATSVPVELISNRMSFFLDVVRVPFQKHLQMTPQVHHELLANLCDKLMEMHNAQALEEVEMNKLIKSLASLPFTYDFPLESIEVVIDILMRHLSSVMGSAVSFNVLLEEKKIKCALCCYCACEMIRITMNATSITAQSVDLSKRCLVHCLSAFNEMDDVIQGLTTVITYYQVFYKLATTVGCKLQMLALWHPIASTYQEELKANNSIGSDNGYESMYETLAFPLSYEAFQVPEELKPLEEKVIGLCVPMWRYMFGVVHAIAAQSKLSPLFFVARLLERMRESASDLDENTSSRMRLEMWTGVMESVAALTLEVNKKQLRMLPLTSKDSLVDDVEKVFVVLSSLVNSSLRACNSADKEISQLACSLSVSTLGAIEKILSTVNMKNVMDKALDPLLGCLCVILLEDPLDSSHASARRKINQSIDSLWKTIMGRIKTLTPVFDSVALEQLSPLIAKSLSTKHRSRKEETIQFWNETFGNTTNLAYPVELVPVLASIKKSSAIVLPRWHEVDKNPFSAASSADKPETLSLDRSEDSGSIFVPPASFASAYDSRPKHSPKQLSPLKRARSPSPRESTSPRQAGSKRRKLFDEELPDERSEQLPLVARPSRAGPMPLTDKQADTWVEQHQHHEYVPGEMARGPSLLTSSLEAGSTPDDLPQGTTIIPGAENSLSSADFMSLVTHLDEDTIDGTMGGMTCSELSETQARVSSVLNRLITHMQKRFTKNPDDNNSR
eukprot:TRINITY_DN10348_c0_g1_i1.p1 TRINITY_DN10348_c0_g1~~TRINITY_DN10348_c0_g1_i1.p1  ORF type:complete len:892 (-),score=141.18 TRINITY_DN10348_c0_g1_i1:295-2970(-)